MTVIVFTSQKQCKNITFYRLSQHTLDIPYYIINTIVIRVLSEINECSESDSCSHGGSCTNNDGGFSCDCTGTGYEGDTCQTGRFHIPVIEQCKLSGK